MIKGGYAGKILRVNLTKQSVEDESLVGESILRQFVGGVGLAAKYLYDEVPPTVQPLDPENRLILMAGPLSGTVWPCSSRYVLMTTHADLPKSCGTAWGGGFWAAKLKMSGYDGIIVQGRATKPTYLSIHSGKPELRDATHLWGKDTHETEEFLREELADPSASVLAIGPAGENVLPGACVANDANHVAGKAGGGTVMGSKMLKCIAISGRMAGVPVADGKGLTELAIEYRKRIMSGQLQKFLHDGGCSRNYTGIADGWKLAVKNYTDELAQRPWAEEMVDTVKRSRHIPRPCFNCPISCAFDAIIGKGPYEGYRVSLAGGAENMEGLGGMIGVNEGGTVLYLTDRLDRLGLESGQIGQSIAILYECYEKGMIDREFTEGLELRWGNADAALVLLDKFLKKEGRLGKLLAEGPRGVARAIGGGAEQFMGGYKGLAMAHDYRASWELILGKAVSSGGPVIEGLGVDGWGPEPELGYPERPEPFDKERAPVVVSLTQKKNRWENCLGVCIFSVWGVEKSLSHYGPLALSLAVGWDPFTKDEALLLGERVVNVMRLFNLRRGLTVDDDLDIGARFLDPFKAGPYAGHSARPHIKEMVHGYYRNMGWEPETGIPTEKTLKRVGLEGLIKETRKLKHASHRR